MRSVCLLGCDQFALDRGVATLRSVETIEARDTEVAFRVVVSYDVVIVYGGLTTPHEFRRYSHHVESTRPHERGAGRRGFRTNRLRGTLTTHLLYHRMPDLSSAFC